MTIRVLTPEWWDQATPEERKIRYAYSSVCLPWDKSWENLSQDEQDTAIVLLMGR
jgi:hypothetical protein